MNLADILVARGLLRADDIGRAIDHQRESGGRLADALVALGMLSQEQAAEAVAAVPAAPNTLADTGLDTLFLLQLMVKGMYGENLELPSAMADAMCLPANVVNALIAEATERKLVEALGTVDTGIGTLQEMRYGMTRTGRDWAVEAMSQCQYFGPAPVTFEAFCERILAQRIDGELVTREQMEQAFSHIVLPDRLLSRLGPAVNSGTAILIYGPAGNGKTTIAEIIGKIFETVVYVPHCFVAEGQIVKLFDPTIHRQIDEVADGVRGLRRERFDKRWVACYRPMVITGGELTLEMLDLKFNELAKFYEAPLHLKALNGTFLIDDFGRQRVKPEDILNRWIVPLNSRVDYLSFHTGKTVQVPFDEMVIFSTNLHPDDLMDPAFQRRIAYKLETMEPDEPLFRRVFESMAAKAGMELTDEAYDRIVGGIRENDAQLAYFQPKFIVKQVLASCKYEGIAPQFTTENVEDALLNLFVKSQSQMFGVARGG